MKKEYMFFIIGIIIIGIISYFFFNNKIVSTITLDINPSIEIDLDKNDRIIEVIPLNEEARNIISGDIKYKKIEDGIDIIIEKTLNYLSVPEKLVLLLHTEGNVKLKEVEKIIIDNLNSKNIQNDIIAVDNITSKDKALSKKYSVSPAKISYINGIIESNNNISIDDLVSKSINELEETKEFGFYCDKGYELVGNSCRKEINVTDAISGEVCQEGYIDYKNKCYEEKPGIETEKEYCREEYELVDNVCVRNVVNDAIPVCENGNYNNKDGKCYEDVYVGDAYEFCRDPGRTLYEHKCLATKPTINGGCLGKDKLYNGKCVNTRNDYYMAEWKCKNGQVLSRPDGSLVNDDKKCYESKSLGEATFRCEDGGILNGKKCNYKEYDRVIKEVICPEGFSLINNRCINLKKSENKVEGQVCSEVNTELKGNKCITYEVIPANR